MFVVFVAVFLVDKVTFPLAVGKFASYSFTSFQVDSVQYVKFVVSIIKPLTFLYVI